MGLELTVSLFRLNVVLAALCLMVLNGCASPLLSTRSAPSKQSSDAALDRARMAKELEVVMRPGMKVCRKLHAGIGNEDWIRGTVVERQNDQVAIRIDDAGRFDHVLDGVPVSRSSLIRGAMNEWTPCE